MTKKKCLQWGSGLSLGKIADRAPAQLACEAGESASGSSEKAICCEEGFTATGDPSWRCASGSCNIDPLYACWSGSSVGSDHNTSNCNTGMGVLDNPF